MGFFTEQEKVFLKRFVEKNRKLIKLVPKEFNLAELSFYVVQRERDPIAFVYYGSGFVTTVLFLHSYVYIYQLAKRTVYATTLLNLALSNTGKKKFNFSQQVATLTMTAEVYLHFEIVNNADVLVLVFTPL